MRSALTALAASLVVFALLCCGDSGDAADGGADASGDAVTLLDGDGVFNDGGGPGDAGGGLVPLVFPALPAGFPAHFSSLTPPVMVARLDDLCAVDTGSTTTNPSVTLCPKGGARQTSSPPNLMVVDAQNATVLWVFSLDITQAVKVTGTRALAIVSAGELDVEGAVDVSGKASAAGPGALDVGGGVGSASPCDGGTGASAGAGFGGDGGGAPGAFGGMFYGEDAGQFVGGSRGGSACVQGGGGGGALQLSSATSLLVLPAGSLRAAGGGGSGGTGASAGGGGSGGTIFLESLAAFLISTDVSANGGGGGGAGITAGVDGLTSQKAAPGGLAGDGGANGGSGGVAAVSPTDGVADTTNASVSGGGGGAVGRIWLRSMKAPTGTPSFSPGPVVLSF